VNQAGSSHDGPFAHLAAHSPGWPRDRTHFFSLPHTSSSLAHSEAFRHGLLRQLAAIDLCSKTSTVNFSAISADPVAEKKMSTVNTNADSVSVGVEDYQK